MYIIAQIVGLLYMITQIADFFCVSLDSWFIFYNSSVSWFIYCGGSDCWFIIDDSSTCKQLLSVLLNLAKQTKSLPPLLRNVCQDIHCQFGDIDKVDLQLVIVPFLLFGKPPPFCRITFCRILLLLSLNILHVTWSSSDYWTRWLLI